MTDQVMGVPSVAEPVESVAQQPETALANEDTSALRHKLELVQADNLTKGEANRKLNERLGELERQLRQRDEQLRTDQQQKLAESGEFKKLWEDAQAEAARLATRITELEAALQAKEEETATERLRATALQQISAANALAPDQLYGLLSPQMRNGANGPSVVTNGIEQPLSAYLQQLKNPGSGWEHHFAASGTRGMGSGPTSTSAVPGMANPFAPGPGFNLTEALKLEAENPELAKLLKAEAGRG